MFDHVTVRVSDRVASERFYAALLHVLDPDGNSVEVVNHHHER